MSAKKALILLILVEAFVQAGLGQSDSTASIASHNEVLERPVRGDELRFLSTTEATREALFVTRTPGGIVAVMDCEEERATQRWMPGGSSLRTALDAIVLADPRFRWVVGHDDVVNLIPRDHEPALLQTNVRTLRLRNVPNVDLALERVLTLPEVKQSEARLHLSEGLKLVVRPNSKSEPEISLRVENLTLLEALNAIARTNGHAVWLYRERHCNGQRTYSLDYVVK